MLPEWKEKDLSPKFIQLSLAEIVKVQLVAYDMCAPIATSKI